MLSKFTAKSVGDRDNLNVRLLSQSSPAASPLKIGKSFSKSRIMGHSSHASKGQTHQTRVTPSDPNGIFSNARWAGDSPHITFKGQIGYQESYGLDRSDWYKFSLSCGSPNAKFRLFGLTQDVDLYLYSSPLDNPIAQSENVGDGVEEVINKRLNSGTYYLQVYSWDGQGTDYSLQIRT